MVVGQTSEGARPVLVVRGQALLGARDPSTPILPLTTNLIDDAEPLRIRIEPRGQLERRSEVLIDQLRAIDNARLISGPVATLNPADLARVDQALMEVLDFTGPNAADSLVSLPPAA